MANTLNTDNKLIAKNTMYLYLRMGLSMVISLYTSRVTLEVLGVVDYGLWVVVAGVVGMFSYINISLMGCASRFLSYELGHGDESSLSKAFSATSTIYIGIAAIVLLLGETVGLWFLENKLVIPETRMAACRILYQTVIVSTLLSVLRVPYFSAIMSSEKMNIYAFIELGGIFSRLLVVYLLLVTPYDHLAFLGFLHVLVNLFLMIAYRTACHQLMPSCKFSISREWYRIKAMLTYSGWDLYSGTAVMARTQGVNMLLNIFFSAVINAANGVATSVQNAVMAFGWNIINAFRPQIIKNYASGNYERMRFLIRKAMIFPLVLLLLLALPLMVEMEYVLELWLKNPPSFAATITCWILLFNLINTATSVVLIGIQATGKISWPSFFNGTIHFLVIPFAWLLFKYGGSPQWPFVFSIIAETTSLLFCIYYLHRLLSFFSPVLLIRDILLKIVVVALLSYFAGYWVSTTMEPSFLRLLAVVATTSLLISILSYFFIFDSSDRRTILEKVRLYYYLHLFVRYLRVLTRFLYMGIIEISRKFTTHDTYVVAGMLFMRNLDPVDSWSFFQWLQSKKIPSRYIVNNTDEFYLKEIKNKNYKDVVVLSNPLDILCQIKLWIHAKAFVVEWNLLNKTIDSWLKRLPDMNYVMLQHGIIGTSISNILIEGLKPFNYINVSSEKEKSIVESFPGIKKESCFIAGLPRYDSLQDLSSRTSDEKILFVMFTWRSFPKGTTPQDIEKTSYWQGIKQILNNEQMEWYKKNNIKIVLALHHSMPQTANELKIHQEIVIAEQKDIQFWITHAHGLLTDFSSISFDFLFIGKPVIYWIPDLQEQTQEDSIIARDKKVVSAIERRKDFFNTAETIEEVTILLDKYSKNGFVLEKEKQEAAQIWFANHTNFSEKVYNAIEQRCN